MKLLRDIWLIFQRQALQLLRNPVWVFVGIFQPVTYLLLFAPLLERALAPLGVTTAAEAYQVFVPGVLVMLAIFGGLFQGFGLIAELRAGILERSRVTPVSRLALLLGRSFRDAATMMFQAIIITALALAFGLRAHLGYILLAYLFLALISLMTSALSYGVALKLRSEAALAPLMNTVALPVFLLSGILLPISRDFGAPSWLVVAARLNPFSWAVIGVRALFAGNPGDDAIWLGLLFTAVLTALAVAWAARAFARSVR
ncbi:MAG: ABC transporter permease [Thermoanaerobaculia bacterium]